MNILKILWEAAVPRKVLVKMNLTLDCSMIKATIGIANFAACDNYRPHFTKIFDKIEAQFERVALFSDLGKLSSFCCTASVQSCVAKFPLRTVWMKILEMKTTQK